MPPETYVILLVTLGTRDEAERMGEGLVDAGLAARGSVIPTIHSFYRQDDRLQRDRGSLLIVTTLPGKVGEARAYIREHHSFEEPHIVTLGTEE